MANEQVRELGIEQLALIMAKSAGVGKWKTWFTDYQFKDEYPDDRYIWLTCVLALKAVDTGTSGIGCILIDGGDNIVAQGHNQVYAPYFRSDLHAEMVVMNEFEDTHRELTKLEGYIMYTSLESCPMCLVRLITSGVNSILHAAEGMNGDVAHRIKNLPQTWVELAKRQVFEQAKCSQDLINAANEIFLLNRDELHVIVKNR